MQTNLINIVTGETVETTLTVARAKEIIDAQRTKHSISVRRFFCCFDAVQTDETHIVFIAIGGDIKNEAELIKNLTIMETYKIYDDDRSEL